MYVPPRMMFLDGRTNSIVPFCLQVLVEKMGLPAGLGSGSSTGYNDLMGKSLEISKCLLYLCICANMFCDPVIRSLFSGVE